jgi:tRNA threonylcarbamoyladenosine biosynthesis protein TsaE
MHGLDDSAAVSVFLPDDDATLEFGKRLASVLAPGRVIYLVGELGAGKTTLVRGILRGLGYNGRVKSPTYTLAESYPIQRPGEAEWTLLHFDLYRMHDPREWLDAGFREIDDAATLRLIEWPERGAGYLPPADLQLTFTIPDEGRTLQCTATRPAGEQTLEALCRIP